MLRFGFAPDKIYYLAKQAFKGEYDNEVILKVAEDLHEKILCPAVQALCLPDGPKVGMVAVSPRGDLRMPSDACSRIWMDQVEKLVP